MSGEPDPAAPPPPASPPPAPPPPTSPQPAPASPEALRSPWLDLLVWPLRRGTLGGVLLLTLAAALLATRDGGATRADREQNAYAQALVGFAIFVVMAIYARRIVLCTAEDDRPVPWGRDTRDSTTLFQDIGSFASVVVVLFLPLAAWQFVHSFAAPPGWLDAVAFVVTGAWGALQLPLALAAVVVSGSVFAALPRNVLRTWRAEPRAARIAAGTSAAFVALLVLSFVLAAGGRPASVTALPEDHVRASDLGDAARAALFALRALAFYAALVSFRVAGLLVREVPEVRAAIAPEVSE